MAIRSACRETMMIVDSFTVFGIVLAVAAAAVLLYLIRQGAS